MFKKKPDARMTCYNQVDVLKTQEFHLNAHISRLKKKYKKHFAAGKAKIGVKTKNKIKSIRLQVMGLKIAANSFYGPYFPISKEGTSIFFCNTENIPSLKTQKIDLNQINEKI